jgi:diacylglycerol kinase family enzyme
MPKHNTKLIINPNADLGRAWRLGQDLHSIVEEFGGADWSGTVYPTHATELARQAAEDGYEMIVSVGGDGTTHEVVNGLMQIPAENRPRLGLVPVGTGNDFAHNSGVESRPEVAMRRVFTGQPKKIDLGIMHDERGRTEYWDNTLGIGFDATVTIRSRRIPVLRGFFVYLISVLQTILLNHDAARLKVKTEAESWEDDLLMLVLCNSARRGLLRGATLATTTGRLDYVGIRCVTTDDVPPDSEVMKAPILASARSHGHLRADADQSDRSLFIHIDGEIFAGLGRTCGSCPSSSSPARSRSVV